LTSYTSRQNNVGKIIAQAINNHNPQDIIKSDNGNLLNWNQELRLPKDVKTVEKNIEVAAIPEEDEGKRRPDIWFYRIEEDKCNGMIEKKLVCNLVEVTIPWGEVKEFQHIENTTYKAEDIAEDSLSISRKRKSDKYEAIEKNMKGWLNMYKDEIKKKYLVERVEVKTFYIIISSLGVLQKQTYNDFLRLLRIKGPGKRQLAKN
jgi:hypothetical protein